MRRLQTAAALTLVAAAAVALWPGTALGAWSRARLMSATGVEQALPYGPLDAQQDSTFMGQPDISGDGRYLAFDTAARNLLVGPDAVLQTQHPGGIFRRAVDDAALELVAPASTSATRQQVTPSISGDGRYVAFDTTLALVARDTDALTDVYVRDMGVGRASPDAYTLVSREDTADAFRLGGESALSADGRRALYYVAEDDATGALRVADVATGAATQLTSDAVLETTSMALSADGTTAMWVDQRPRDRTAPGAYLSGEFPLAADPSIALDTAGIRDLLWRRVADPGPARRIASAGDADDPACPAGAVLAPDSVIGFDGPRGPCDGVFTAANPSGGRAGLSFAGASLSADGRFAGFVTNLPRRTGGQQADAFVRDMAAPGGAKATTRELTRFATTRTPDGNTAIVGGTTDGLSISGDGRTVAVTTLFERTSLGRPTLISPTVTPGRRNVYVIDLDAETIERVTRAYDGAEANGDSQRPILSADGRRVAFRSTAANLLLGDGNLRPDAFVAERSDADAPPLEQVASTVSGAGATIRATQVQPSWRMSVTIGRGGGVLYVDVRAPAAGRIEATARTRSSRRSAGRATARIPGAGQRRLRVRIPSEYRRLARRPKGLAVAVTVRFRPAGGGGALTRSLTSRYKLKAARRGARR
ncbi:hypothetical protein LRS13_23085 [Svornostia abyssi]|uniref:WD40-like Beta Propeller Repeat n=1 Tax=Svornostia abyssi TaxID=2898438 RepID=A0ABY5PFR0_9ACTN|nr:hypothetical protein LRS13_23085 [Parviterribacteraceae bacterium J379]